jgi:hypothetical protein
MLGKQSQNRRINSKFGGKVMVSGEGRSPSLVEP